MNPINKFKGPSSYEETDTDIFFGRENETENLLQLVKLNSLTLLFGKSGLGKSSLLKAGLFPKLRANNFMPIFVRPDYSNTTQDFVKYTYNEIIKPLHEDQITRKKEGQTVWEFIHSKPYARVDNSGTSKLVTPVLIFDQFEEIFTLGSQHGTNILRSNTDHLIDFLSEIIENAIPYKLNDDHFVSDEVREKLFLKYERTNSPVKVIFSFREEYLSQIYDLSDRMPSLVNSFLHFRLDFLKYDSAFEIIGKAGNEYFDSNSISKTLRLLTNTENDSEARAKVIESFMLSTFCSSEFDKQIINQKLNKIDENKLSHYALNELLLNFFEKGISQLSKHELKWFINSFVTDRGNRIPVHLKESIASNFISENSVKSLIDNKIIRNVFYNEQQCIELIHDRFASIVNKEKAILAQKKKERKFRIAAGLIVLVLLLIFLIENEFDKKREQLASARKKLEIDSMIYIQRKSKTFEDSINMVIQANEILRAQDSLVKLSKSSYSELGNINYEKNMLESRLNNTNNEIERLKIQLSLSENEIKRLTVEKRVEDRAKNDKLIKDQTIIAQLENTLKDVSNKFQSTTTELTNLQNQINVFKVRFADVKRNNLAPAQSDNLLTSYLNEVTTGFQLNNPSHIVEVYIKYNNADARANQFMAVLMSRNFPAVFRFNPQTDPNAPYNKSGILYASFDADFATYLKAALNGTIYEDYDLTRIQSWYKNVMPSNGKSIIVLDY